MRYSSLALAGLFLALSSYSAQAMPVPQTSASTLLHHPGILLGDISCINLEGIGLAHVEGIGVIHQGGYTGVAPSWSNSLTHLSGRRVGAITGRIGIAIGGSFKGLEDELEQQTTSDRDDYDIVRDDFGGNTFASPNENEQDTTLGFDEEVYTDPDVSRSENLAAIPEPGSLLLVTSGLLGMRLLRSRRRV